MRLATLFDIETNEQSPVFELPGGQRVELRELFSTATATDARLSAPPLYFSQLINAVEHLEDVVEAARAWAIHRSDRSERGECAPYSGVTALAKFCPPIPQPRSVREFDAYEAHARNARARIGLTLPARWAEAPSFGFVNPSSLLGHDAPLVIPKHGRELDWGMQLGVVIGRGGRDISVDGAFGHVAGFTIVNAFVLRDIQRREQTLGQPPGKSRDFATAVGPYLVTVDALRDRIDSAGMAHLNVIARLNGDEIARAGAADMQFSWPRLIAAASADAQLHPGDILTSGTLPGGSFADRGLPRLLEPGDSVEVEIERLGFLRTPIIERSPDRNAAPEHQRAPLALV